MSHETKLDIFYKKDLVCSIDTENPDISEFIKYILVNRQLVPEEIKCQTLLESFDKNSFDELLRQILIDIRKELDIEIRDFKKAIESFKSDQSVDEFYLGLIDDID